MRQVFIDSSAFIALYLADDDFHKKAVQILKELREAKNSFITSNFVLDEVFTFLRAKVNKKKAVDFAEFLAENTDIIKIIRITVRDEREAFFYFKSLDGRGISFTDSTSFALMKRSKITTAFTFDQDFTKAGFKILPQ